MQSPSAVAARLSPTISGLTNKTSPQDVYSFTTDGWQIGTTDCFRCTAGPAVATAVYAAASGNAAALTRVIRYFDNAIATQQGADGAFDPHNASPDIQTTMFVNALGETEVLLGTRLSASQQSTWTTAVTRGADYLVKIGDLSWYANGNLQISDTLSMALAFKLSGIAKYQAYTTQAANFTVSPPQGRWPGRGLIYTTHGGLADGSDSAGYLTETGTGGTGFDADYGQVQLDTASWWYLLTSDPTALRLTNILFNGLRPHIDTSDWHLDTSGGTRHPTQGRWIYFVSSAIAVLTYKGGRTDLARYVRAQTNLMNTVYLSAETHTNDAQAWGFGSELAPTMLALT